MRFEVEITEKTIAYLMCAAIEGGDPVTNASKGGWCSGIYAKSPLAPPKGQKDWSEPGIWYASPEFWAAGFTIEIAEFHEETGKTTKHKITPTLLKRGLSTMAAQFPRQFAMVMEDNYDATCADALLQSICFGEEKYA